MFRPKTPKLRGIHISPPTPLPCPNPELPLPPPRPLPPSHPLSTTTTVSDLDRDSQTLLDVVEAYERVGAGAETAEEQTFVQGLRREAKGEGEGLLAEKIMRKVGGRGERQRGNVGEGRFHKPYGAGGREDVGKVGYPGRGGGVEDQGRGRESKEMEREQEEGERVRNVREGWDDEDDDDDEDDHNEQTSETTPPPPTPSHPPPRSPAPPTRLPRPYTPKHPSPTPTPTPTPAPIDWTTIRFSTFARRTAAGFARNGRKRDCDPNDLITDEDMHRKKSDAEVAAEVAAAVALRDDVEECERRFGLAWEWLNAGSGRKEGVGEAVGMVARGRRGREG